MSDPSSPHRLPGREDLDAASARVSARAHRTPILRSSTLDACCQAEMHLKCENFQKIGAFKFRGATNAVGMLTEAELARGVVTHSSGNHAQALAMAARDRGTHATIVMPENSAAVKQAAVRGYGATIVHCRPTTEDREATLERIRTRDGSVLVHPFDDWGIICGQGTAVRELVEDAGPFDVILAPVGGGGLLAGTALTCHHLAPDTRVIGAEPRAADDAKRSLDAGSIQASGDPKTLADGLRTGLGERTFAVIKRYVDDIILVDEAEIVTAMRMIWERMKIVIEPSAAVPIAALLSDRLDVAGQRVGVIVSGGNVDLEQLPWLARTNGTSTAPHDHSPTTHEARS